MGGIVNEARLDVLMPAVRHDGEAQERFRMCCSVMKQRGEDNAMPYIRSRLLIPATLICLFASFLAFSAVYGRAQDQSETEKAEPNLTEEEMKQFLLKAKILRGRQTSTGVTRPYKLTLSDGTLTHDAGFQSVDIFKSLEKFSDGTMEINFRDTYQFNIAAYELAKLLDIHHMMPVTVERKWKGKKGSLTWWIDAMMDGRDRITKKIPIPDVDAYNKQMYYLIIFSQLVYDADRNQTNLLITPDWKLYMIDFSRAFRLHKKLPNPEDLKRCNRQLLEKLRQLDRAEIDAKLKKYLQKAEIEALMARRDLIVAHFDQLIAQKGEIAVLY
jgi:hypothetical protein